MSAQPDSSRRVYSVEAEISAVASLNRAVPFWLRANRFGAVPDSPPAAVVMFRFAREYRQPGTAPGRKFDWGASVRPILYRSPEAPGKVLLPEAQVKVRYGSLELYAGRRMDVTGLGDTLLTSGFYAVSGNALPIPKVQLSTTGFVPVKWFHSYLAVSAGLAHGWYDVDYLQGARLHQKYLYLRFGRASAAVRFYAGLNHQVQWAGHAEYLKGRPDIAIDGAFPSSWKLFPYVFLAYTPRNWYEKQGFTSFDSYRMGNHLGSQDLAAEGVVAGEKFLLYHQHVYEDVSGLVWKNFPDGLWGLAWSARQTARGAEVKLEKVTLEYLTTLSQSGRSFYLPGTWYQGADNYFNHAQYRKGWSYRERGIGTPFVTPGHESRDRGPAVSYFTNNRLSMLHLGLKMKYRGVSAMLLTSYSLNYGLPGDSFGSAQKQLSGGLAIETGLEKDWALIVRLGVDRGDLLPQTTGGQLGIRKKWL
ncbi:MAG: hypothetical protein ABS46_00280 [Cytophagaceae bacterium SCN 52-12]|nr:MAG: hypothetical protein ABS46_00280 [Cytophagaceae bacterium SCN 52-12]